MRASRCARPRWRRAQTRAIALAPDHALVVGRGDLAAMLEQPAVGIEQELCVVERAAVALVHADGNDRSRLPAGLADGLGGGRRDGDRLFEQALVFRAHPERRLHEGEVGVVRHHRLREGSEQHALATEGEDLPADLVHGALAAVEDRAQLDGGGLDDGHRGSPIVSRSGSRYPVTFGVTSHGETRTGLLEPNSSGCFATYSRILVAGRPMIASKSRVSRSYRLSAWS